MPGGEGSILLRPVRGSCRAEMLPRTSERQHGCATRQGMYVIQNPSILLPRPPPPGRSYRWFSGWFHCGVGVESGFRTGMHGASVVENSTPGTPHFCGQEWEPSCNAVPSLLVLHLSQDLAWSSQFHWNSGTHVYSYQQVLMPPTVTYLPLLTSMP